MRDAPEGVLRLYVDLSVDVSEMREWRPERITAYFAGVERALRAVYGAPDRSPVRGLLAPPRSTRRPSAPTRGAQ